MQIFERDEADRSVARDKYGRSPGQEPTGEVRDVGFRAYRKSKDLRPALPTVIGMAAMNRSRSRRGDDAQRW